MRAVSRVRGCQICKNPQVKWQEWQEWQKMAGMALCHATCADQVYGKSDFCHILPFLQFNLGVLGGWQKICGNGKNGKKWFIYTDFYEQNVTFWMN